MKSFLASRSFSFKQHTPSATWHRCSTSPSGLSRAALRLGNSLHGTCLDEPSSCHRTLRTSSSLARRRWRVVVNHQEKFTRLSRQCWILAWIFIMEFVGFFQFLAIYPLFLGIFSHLAVIFSMLLIDACFICSFWVTNWVFRTGEMHK